LPTTASWENTDLPQYGNTAAFGDWNNDGFPELAVADNDQLGGPGRFKVYDNISGELETTPTWHSSSGGYGSNVSWIDLDLDSDLDLAGGRWFDAARIYENSGGVLASAPVWISETESVIENMFWGDVDNDGLHSDGATMASGDGVRTFFYLGRSPVRSVDEVLVDGAPMTGYVEHAGNGWIVMSSPPAEGEAVEIYYTYSTDLDLGVTNWDTNEGNYLFLNTGASDVPSIVSTVAQFHAYPNPVSTRAQIRLNGQGAPHVHLAIYDISGRLVKTIHDGPVLEGLTNWDWDRRDDRGRRVSGGVYFVRTSMDTDRSSLKLVLLD
jgi:hypothetical protein